MLSFIIGAACAVGAIKLFRRARHFHVHGYGGFGPGYGNACGRRGFRPRQWLLRSTFEDLETTPGQEKVILAALHELRGDKGVVLDELKQTRADLARAVRGGMVDDAALEEAFARHDRLLARLRVSFVEAIKKVAEALDEPQRARLADRLERGRPFGGARWGGPYRAWSV